MAISQQEISDRMEINDVLVRYTRAIDQRDYELLDTCFTADAHLDYTASGGIRGAYPEVRLWLEKALAQFDAMMHMIGNVVIEVDGDEARSGTYLMNPMGVKAAGGGLQFFTVGGEYVDRLVRTSQGWRIRERIEKQTYLQGGLPDSLQTPS